MEQLYLCAFCSEENEILIDAVNGEAQMLNASCRACGLTNRIAARYNFHSSEFDLSVEREAFE